MMKIITEPIEDSQDFALYEDPQDVSSNQGDSSIHIDHIDEGSCKRPINDAGDSVFGSSLILHCNYGDMLIMLMYHLNFSDISL